MGHHHHGHVLLRQLPDHIQHFTGELRVQSGGGLVEKQHFRGQSQGAGDGHPLLLSAGELVRVIVQLVSQTHPAQKLLALCLDLRVQCLFVPLISFTALRLELGRQGHVFQRGILGEQIEILKHQAEMEPVAPDLRLAEGLAVRGVKNGLPVYRDQAGAGHFQKVQAAEQGGLAAAGGADHGQGLSSVHGEANPLEDLQLVKAFI